MRWKDTENRDFYQIIVNLEALISTLSPTWAKFGRLLQDYGILLRTKFCRDGHILLYFITTHKHAHMTDL